MSAAAPSHPAEALVSQLQRISGLFATDLRNMSHEMLDANLGGKARSGYDLAYEVVTVNKLVLDGAGDPPTPGVWMKAPDSFKDKDAAVREFETSIEGVCSNLLNSEPEKLQEIVESPLGPMPRLALAQILPMHIMYHSGQLNYIQTLHGDDAFHWA